MSKKEFDNYVKAEDDYRGLKMLIESVESMPAHIRECKFSAPPKIPAEFKEKRLPSNMFFSQYQFTIQDMVEHLKVLCKHYQDQLPDDLKNKIDKGK